VPGAEGGWVRIRDAVKRRLPDDVPFPAAFKGGNGAGGEAAADTSQAPAEAGPAEPSAETNEGQ
jgi:large subunit ribosomal protein L3